MEEQQLAGDSVQKTAAKERNDTFMKWFQSATLVFLLILWVGYCIALFRGTATVDGVSTYTLSIIMFSLLNADVLFGREKAQNKVLDVIAKTEGILLLILAFATVILTLVK